MLRTTVARPPSPMTGMAKLMHDETHRDFVQNYLLKQEYSEACVMFMTFYTAVLKRFPEKSEDEVLQFVRTAHTDSNIRREMIKTWRGEDVKNALIQ